MKILIQLEIEYEEPSEWNYKTGYIELIRKLKDHFENCITIPETEKILFKSLGKVGISRIIQ